MKRNLSVIFSMIFIVSLFSIFSGCGTIKSMVTKDKLTPEARYYDARKTFNDNLETYTTVYDLTTPERQTKWKEKIDPLFKTAGEALDIWKVSLNTPTGVEKEQLFKSALRNLLTVLITEGIIKLEVK